MERVNWSVLMYMERDTANPVWIRLYALENKQIMLWSIANRWTLMRGWTPVWSTDCYCIIYTTVP